MSILHQNATLRRSNTPATREVDWMNGSRHNTNASRQTDTQRFLPLLERKICSGPSLRSFEYSMLVYTKASKLKKNGIRTSPTRNAVLVPISQGTKVTIVTEYVPFRYSTRTASVRRCMGTSTITPCYDGERLKTQNPGELIKYTKHRLSRQGHPWPGYRPV